jgi:hypothetical protein
MLHRYKIAVPAAINKQHTKALCRQKVEFFNVKNLAIREVTVGF